MALSEAEKAKEALRAKYLAVGEKVSERVCTVSPPAGEDVLTMAASNHAMKQVEALLHSEAQESSSAITVLQVGHSTARLAASPPLTHARHTLVSRSASDAPSGDLQRRQRLHVRLSTGQPRQRRRQLQPRRQAKLTAMNWLAPGRRWKS